MSDMQLKLKQHIGEYMHHPEHVFTYDIKSKRQFSCPRHIWNLVSKFTSCG